MDLTIRLAIGCKPSLRTGTSNPRRLSGVERDGSDESGSGTVNGVGSVVPAPVCSNCRHQIMATFMANDPLVVCQFLKVGYKRFSLMRALSVVKRQSTLVAVVLR